MKNFYIVRHALTDHNKEKRFTGVTDIGISKESYEKIGGVANFFEDINVDKIYVSALSRTQQTIKPLIDFKNIDPIVEPGINEMNFGDFETLTVDDILEIEPNFLDLIQDKKASYTFPNGESINQAYDRHVKAFMKIVEETNDGESVVIATHGGFIKNVLSYIMVGNIDLHWKFITDNIGLSHVVQVEDFFTLKKFNQYIGY